MSEWKMWWILPDGQTVDFEPQHFKSLSVLPAVCVKELVEALQAFVHLGEIAGTFGKGAGYLIDPSECAAFGKACIKARSLLQSIPPEVMRAMEGE